MIWLSRDYLPAASTVPTCGKVSLKLYQMPGVNEVVSGQQQNEINKDAPVDVIDKNQKEILAKDTKGKTMKMGILR